jgi:hypothetical protein
MQSAPLLALITLALAACNADKRPATEPSTTTTTTGVTTTSGPASPGDPTGITPERGGVGVTSAAPASPMEGNCPSGGSPSDARDRADCERHCRGMDEAVPLGSHCLSQRVACEAECEARFQLTP